MRLPRWAGVLGLAVIIGLFIAALGSAHPQPKPAARPSSLATPRIPAGATAATPHHAVTSPAKPRPRVTRAVTRSAPPPAPSSAPAPAASPAPVTTAPAAQPACYPQTGSGNCYEPGEYCRASDHGANGLAGNGEAITCEDNNGWRWEPA